MLASVSSSLKWEHLGLSHCIFMRLNCDVVYQWQLCVENGPTPLIWAALISLVLERINKLLHQRYDFKAFQSPENFRSHLTYYLANALLLESWHFQETSKWSVGIVFRSPCNETQRNVILKLEHLDSNLHIVSDSTELDGA